jgi:hypothetical protein
MRPLVALLGVLAAAPAHPDSQVEHALQALRGASSLKVRAQAALVLGQRGAQDAIPALAEAVRGDPAPAVRIAAAAALAKLGGAGCREPLTAAARQDPDERVREAAARGLSELRESRAPMTFTIEEPSGEAGGPPARAALRESIEKHLREGGYPVVDGGAYRLKPAVLALDVDEHAGRTVIAVKATLIAIDGQGRMAAMLESGARLKAGGVIRDGAVSRYAAAALDAAAKTLCEDLAARLR